MRLLDFPRLPLAAALAAVGIGLLFFLRGAPRSTAPVLAIVVCALVVDVWVLWPYLPTHGLRVDACPAGRRLSVLVANVQLGNRNAKPLVEAVERTEPDLFLAMETDAWWNEALKPVLASMPHALQRITGSYYGIHFFSRLILVNGEIRHLGGQDTPAVVTGVTLRSGEVVDFVGVHPKPPQAWAVRTRPGRPALRGGRRPARPCRAGRPRRRPERHALGDRGRAHGATVGIDRSPSRLRLRRDMERQCVVDALAPRPRLPRRRVRDDVGRAPRRVWIGPLPLPRPPPAVRPGKVRRRHPSGMRTMSPRPTRCLRRPGASERLDPR